MILTLIIFGMGVGGIRRRMDVRQRIMNVAKDWERFPTAMFCRVGRFDGGRWWLIKLEVLSAYAC